MNRATEKVPGKLGEEPFMVMAFTEPQKEGQLFLKWPQHMTVALWMQGHRLQAANRIAAAVSGTGPLRAVINSESRLGKSEHEVPVWMLEPRAALAGLHNVVMQAAHKYDTRPLGLKADEDYLPHIAQQVGQPSHRVGEQLVIPTISIVGLMNGNQKTLLRNIPL